MALETAYFLACALVFLALFVMWKKEDMLNVSIKVVLLVMGLSGLLQFLMSIGYIVKV